MVQVGEREVVADSQRQAAFCVQALQRGEDASGVHRMDGGEPESGERGESAIHRPVEVGIGGGWNLDADELHRRLAENPRWIAGLVAIDYPTRRVFGCLVDARELQRR